MASASLVFAEAVRQEIADGGEAILGIGALRRHRDGGALRRRERQQTHDRAPAHGLAAAGDRDVRVEFFDRLYEFGRGPRVEATPVDDREFAMRGTLGDVRRRTIVVEIHRAHFPVRTRDAILMYLRPASWACDTASSSPSSSRTLASL